MDVQEPTMNTILESASAPVVSVRGASCTLGGRKVLDDVSLDVMRGQVVVLIGPSGAGKTTLLRSLNHLEAIDTGEILIEGVPIGHRDLTSGKKVSTGELARRRREIGFVFQHFNLFPHMTAAENVWNAPVRVLGTPKDQARRDAQELLERVGLADEAQSRPSQLSGGQQQRVAIARALAMRQCPGRRDGGGGARGHARTGARAHDDGRGHPRDAVRPRRGGPHRGDGWGQNHRGRRTGSTVRQPWTRTHQGVPVLHRLINPRRRTDPEE
jgi:ABC-type lipoprotein export system ATPase subunit